ncbi:MAG: hypothetical protein KA100_00745 [Rickettsiales bacterium]|nr:hypothetical protein [Rickettsiales bacterium]
MSGLFNKIETSFKAAMKGEESTSTLIKWWGIIAFLVSFFIIDRAVMSVDNRVFDVVLSSLAVIYFVWHIYVLRKCSPKKPKLSKEEKQFLKREARKNLGKKILRKLLLQEPVGEWNPVMVTMVIDVLCITQFMSYIFR